MPIVGVLANWNPRPGGAVDSIAGRTPDASVIWPETG